MEGRPESQKVGKPERPKAGSPTVGKMKRKKVEKSAREKREQWWQALSCGMKGPREETYNLPLGSQHYQNTHFGDFENYSKRDSEKLKICKAQGILVIHVPYTWDKSVESLTQIILASRPDLAGIF
jgi:hypothetical protein